MANLAGMVGAPQRNLTPGVVGMIASVTPRVNSHSSANFRDPSGISWGIAFGVWKATLKGTIQRRAWRVAHGGCELVSLQRSWVPTAAEK